jgi:hypothetical protein
MGFNFFHFLLFICYLEVFLLPLFILEGEGGHGFVFIFFTLDGGEVGVGFTFSLFVIFQILEVGRGACFF